MKKSPIFVVILMIVVSNSLTGLIIKGNNLFTSRGVFYVGGDGPGNYSFIQSAIDDASNGDTIRVYDGIYYENIVVDKMLKIMGNGSNFSIIDGGYADHKHVVHITANEVEFSGFGIKNSYMGHEYGGIGVQSSNNKIYNNSCWDNLYGLILFNGNNNIIKNSFSNNKRNGIYIKSSGNIIYKNNCHNSLEKDGIWLYICTENIISSNMCSNNDKNGIALYQSDNNQIFNNTCNNNVLYDGILIYESSNNEIKNNILFSNNDEGIGVSYYSCNNTVVSNKISNNNCGIDIDYYSENNTILENIIGPNNGIGLESFCSNNIMYHNNFVANTENALDEGSNNTWDSGYPSGGNYWNDYIGSDSNEDGIGDTHYSITGGTSQDLYPLIYQWGENLPVASFSYFNNNKTFDASNSYDRDGVIISYEWDFDDGSFGLGLIIVHVYNNSGTYNVTLTITDDKSYEDNITKTIEVELPNQPPGAPIINGPNSGKIGKTYSYTFISEDSNNDDIFYYVDWGDDSIENWIGPYSSNEHIELNHCWNEKREYTILARVKDVHGAIGNWSEFKVTMPKNKLTNYNQNLLNWIFNHFPNVFPILRYMLG